MPKLLRSRLKSEAFTTVSPVKSARPSYPGCPWLLPKVPLRMLKSVELTTLSLLASPSSSRPISWLFAPGARVTLPDLASVWGFFTRQL